VEAAAWTYYVVMNAFNGIVAERPSFTVYPGKEASFVRFYSTQWEQVQERMKRTTILCRDFGKVFDATDSPDTFFYLDPPYLCATNNQQYYRCTFSENDHGRLQEYLGELEGRFLLSYGDEAGIRELYEGFTIRPSSLVPGELFILNYEPPNPPFYGSCSTGIPETPESGVFPASTCRRAPMGTPNCPHCGSLRVQQLYRRVTYADERRSWEPRAYECNQCNGLFIGPGRDGR